MSAASFVRPLLPLVFVLGAAACGVEHRAASSPPASATLLVENRSATDIILYLADGHAPLRLGRVTALSRARLSVPVHAAESGARLLLRSTGSVDAYVDDPVRVGAGGTIELTVHPLLRQSTLDVLSFSR
jgi:hypothetical protein